MKSTNTNRYIYKINTYIYMYLCLALIFSFEIWYGYIYIYTVYIYTYIYILILLYICLYTNIFFVFTQPAWASTEIHACECLKQGFIRGLPNYGFSAVPEVLKAFWVCLIQPHFTIKSTSPALGSRFSSKPVWVKRGYCMCMCVFMLYLWSLPLLSPWVVSPALLWPFDE